MLRKNRRRGENLNIWDLNYFLIAAQESRVTQAMECLNMTQMAANFGPGAQHGRFMVVARMINTAGESGRCFRSFSPSMTAQLGGVEAGTGILPGD